ncbi:MAG TPA: J domain-containing protein [Bryobacteraceae bacterium]|nr:J domain-containing protein [Bryobacteraceae bacterium]
MHSGLSSTRGEAQQRIKDSLDAQEVTVILDSGNSKSSRLRARLVAQVGALLKLQLTAALGEAVVVGIAGEIQTAAGKQLLLGQYLVRSCKLAGIGRYLVDLEPQADRREASTAAAAEHFAEDTDYYELLQVSRHADTETIHRVYHVLAQRYHPDNLTTGSPERFYRITEAHAALSDAERRAAYDVRLAADDKSRLRIFDSLESTQGVQAETRKRQGILRLLYTRRLVDPHDPSMRARDFAEMLACPIEHLEFSLWFLREKRLLVRSDNNRYEITWQGVEMFESVDSTFAKKAHLTLPAPAYPAAQ